uniref:Uncharacterized protein n=1 Tax=Vespula pensylvanica TaxID=30213 RepID=A0A834UA74_VESPE|nr:hypothetical protein H0235_007881 [Vespula pensylvanica]
MVQMRSRLIVQQQSNNVAVAVAIVTVVAIAVVTASSSKSSSSSSSSSSSNSSSSNNSSSSSSSSSNSSNSSSSSNRAAGCDVRRPPTSTDVRLCRLRVNCLLLSHRRTPLQESSIDEGVHECTIQRYILISDISLSHIVIVFNNDIRRSSLRDLWISSNEV